ncbi:DDE superfamily endonuclease-domain-containing protein [Suillus paluster]|uniref:DDE superfamily endonuclease-domain-containing protein n=1 Tax=Suillus paluster TaxID=48578 RepID=UPI001B86CB34|nr:DDE superfamily endonuclease-domain-containing protein [Suillus paluster]KAG1727550.1 DDE superfamily endonuclease-domain-containing protein [Suillus paluster]
MSLADMCRDGVSILHTPVPTGAVLLVMGLVRIRKSISGRRGKLRASSDPTYESRIQAAIQGIANGLYKSIAAAAKEQNVSHQTLSDRCLGVHKPRRLAQESRQLLSAAQEETVVDWCNLASTSATPIHPAKLRASDTIGEFFEMQKKLDDNYNKIPPEHHWNMDEKGNQMGGGRKNTGMKFIFSAEDSDCYRVHSDNLELVTIIECVSTAGAKMPPWFVLSEGPAPDIRDLKDKVGGVSFSPTGWTDHEIADYWFRNHFVPTAEKHCVDPEKPIVLTVDGHSSHEQRAIQRAAYDNGVIIHAFPSKTTHKIQPLDVGMFSSVQRPWTKHCDKCLADGVEIDRYNFIHEYMAIHHVITPELVQKAFKKTGIYPLNLSVFTDKDFAPSLVYQTTTHLPPSYPADIPSSPMAAPSDVDEVDKLMRLDDSEEEDSEDDTDFFPMADDEHDLDSESSDSESEEEEEDAQPSRNDTRITRSTSLVSGSIPHPVIPTYNQAMMLTKEELWYELQHMYEQNGALVQTTQILTAQLDATNAHCTMAQRALAQS